MDYISPDRSLEGACGDPEPLFEDQDGNLLEHMDYDGEGISQHECPPLNEGLLDPADQISFLAADSLPFMNDQIPCNVMKSASTSPASPLKQAHEHNVHTEPDMQKDAAEQNLQDSYSEGHNTSVGYDIHKKTGVVDAVPPQELHESSGNDTSYFQQEITHSDTYLGDSMLAENSSRDYQLNNSGADDDEIPNSSALQMENVDTRVLHETSHNLRNGIEDDQMNGRDSSPCDEHDNENFNSAVSRNSSPRDEHDNENFNSAVAPTYSDVMEQENSGSKNCVSIPSNQWDSPRERSTRLEKGTPSPDRRVSLPLEMSPNAHSSDKLESPRPAKEVGKSAHSRSPTERRRSRSPEKHDINRRRASSRELSPHARQTSPPEKKARREHHRRGDGSPRRRSVSPRRRSSPKGRNSPRRRDSPARRKDSPARRRDSSPRRKDSSPRRRDASPRRRDASPRKRDASPRRRDSSPRRRDSPARRRDSSPRRRDSPARRRDRSKSRSPSRKADTSKHRREHGRSRSRSPHSKDHHRRSPRGRHSPRRRSPPSSHRRHSPKKAWSPPANRKTGLGKPGKNLFIAGFSYATTERELEKKFSKYGRVTSARVVRDKRSGDSRGFGFVSLERDEDADAAIRACDETEWNGRIILVEKSKAPTW